MRRRNAPCVVLVCEDVKCLVLVATEIAATGCEVLCALDLRQAAEFVRARRARRYVLVQIGEELVPPAEQRAEAAAHLLHWKIECDELDDMTGSAISEARFVN